MIILIFVLFMVSNIQKKFFFIFYFCILRYSHIILNLLKYSDEWIFMKNFIIVIDPNIFSDDLVFINLICRRICLTIQFSSMFIVSHYRENDFCNGGFLLPHATEFLIIKCIIKMGINIKLEFPLQINLQWYLYSWSKSYDPMILHSVNYLL